MFRLSSGSLCALGVLSGVAASALICLGCPSERALEPVQLLLGMDVSKEEQRRRELEVVRTAALARTYVRMKLIRALADGRLPLLPAAAQLRKLDLSAPVFRWQEFRDFYPGETDDERFCRKAIEGAVGLLVEEPGRAHTLRQRLETELREALRRGPLLLSPTQVNPHHTAE